MYAVEFQTTVKNGAIHIPPEYRHKFRPRVRVILLAEATTETTTNLIDELLAAPLQVKDFHPLSREEIYAR